MEFYKKILLTLSSAGAVVSCAPLSNITKPVTARVVNITKYHYLDQDGDGAVDNCLYIKGDTEKNEQCYFYDYIRSTVGNHGEKRHYDLYASGKMRYRQ